MEDNAEYFIECIGQGVGQAFRTCNDFLGIEVAEYETADIRPEYVTTVEVAKKLTLPERYVSLETHMKDLRKDAEIRAILPHWNDRKKRKEIRAVLGTFNFGKRDSERIDIVVRPSDNQRPPLLLAEAKLGVTNPKGLIKDIGRIARLLLMYRQVGLLEKHSVYGAILFHSSKEGRDERAAEEKAKNLLDKIDDHLNRLKTVNPWLHVKSGLLSVGASHVPVQGAWECHGDDQGGGGMVFAKKSFTFAPGLVLLGNSDDIDTVKF